MESMTLCFQVSLLLLVLFISPRLFAQKKFLTKDLSQVILFATVDRPGDLYVVTDKDEISKFDKDGTVFSVYRNKPIPTLFDPRDGSRLFAYFRSDQHYSFLNPWFEVTSSGKIDPSVAITPWLMCVSGDHNFWVLDAEDHSLKKINSATGTVSIDAKISEKSSDISFYTYIREYQGFVFLLHKEKGVLIFSNLGKHLKTIGPPSLSHFNFLGEEMYFQEGNKIKFFNLFTAETREMILAQEGRFILMTDERLYVIGKTTIDFFEVSH